MASDDDMREIIARVDAALDRNREAFDRNTAAFHRHAAASDRNTVGFERTARAWDTTAAVLTGLVGTVAEMRETLEDGRDEQRAQTQAILRLLDEKSGGSPDA